MATSENCELALTSQAVRTMAVLLHCFRHREPVLLVGETGIGKTSAAVVRVCHSETKSEEFE